MRRFGFLNIFLAVFIFLFTLVAIPASALIGGKYATLARTWIVDLADADTGEHYCAGSLYKRQWVITAARCIVVYSGLQDKKARIGSNDRTSGGAVVIGFARVIPHPNYRWTTDGGTFDDVGLIKLATPAPVLNLPVTLSTNSGSYWDEKRLRMLGWGVQCEGCSTFPDRLKVLDRVESLPAVDCRTGTRYQYSTELCLAADRNKTPCAGDDGDPVTNPLTGALVGVTVRSTICGNLGHSDITDATATRTAEYRSWIDTTIANNEKWWAGDNVIGPPRVWSGRAGQGLLAIVTSNQLLYGLTLV